MNPFFSLRAKPGFLPRYLQFAFLFAALVFCAIPIRAAAPKLNFVFILADDFGWKDLGCYGSTFYKTPNIDRLALHGMKFTDFYAACPVCSPTRASILTGKYPARLNLTDWIPGMKDKPEHKLLRPEFLHQLPLEETTIAEALKALGYVSASIGKWHLGGDGFGPEQQGFDLNIGGTAAGHPTTYFFPFHTKGDALPNLAEGKANEYLTDRLTDEALKFIEKNRAKPFFLYLSHFAVHIPLMAKPELIAKYSETTKNGGAQTNAVYAAMIESLDDSMGRIVQKLDELKLTENTVVIFTSDNGGLAMNQGGKGIPTSNLPLRDGKGFLHEGGIRVPLIVKWPGAIRENSVCETPVSSIDFFPTFMELAGLHTTNVVDGLSLVPLLKGNGSISKRELYWHYPHYSDQGGKPGGAIRDGDFKLIEDYETGRLELYNLKEDVGEKRNIANQDAAKANELERKLDLWRRNVKAQMMMPNPDYVPLRERIQTNPRKLLK